MKQFRGDKVFGFFNYAFLLIISLLAIYPFIYVISASLSSPEAVTTGKVLLLPKETTLEAYKLVFEEKLIWTSYLNTIFYTVAGTAVQVLITTMGAYALSKKRLYGRFFITLLITLTMWFRAGIIPTYLNISEFGLANTRTGIIIAFACSAFYVILMRTYFQSIPDSLEESAFIDGANDFQIMWKVFFPLSTPAIATIGMYYAVERWNGFFWAMVLLRDQSKIPLQVLLRKLVVRMELLAEQMASYDFQTFSKETFICATIVVSVIPVFVAYPFIQKYFVKGVMVGAIKE